MREKICTLICKVTFGKVCLGWCASKCCKIKFEKEFFETKEEVKNIKK